MNANFHGKIYRIINRLINEGRNRFVIYPFGERGRLVKRVLNESFGITEQYLFDKVASEDTSCRVIAIEQSKEMDLDGCTVLLASDNRGIYSDVRHQAIVSFSFEAIVDLFSPSFFYDLEVYYDTSYYSEKLPSYTRYSLCESCMKEIYARNVKGAVAELGVLKGEFANIMSMCFPERNLYLFDTFEGVKEEELPREESEKWDAMQLKTASRYFRNVPEVEAILGNIAWRDHTIVKKGLFPDTLKGDEKLSEESFCLVDIDMGFYEPTKAALEYFYDKLSPGGYMFIDDVRHKGVYSVRQAFEQFCEEKRLGYSTIQYADVGLAVVSKPYHK